MWVSLTDSKASVTFLSESWRDVVGSKIHPKKDFWIIISYLIISDPSCSWCTFHQTLEISFLPVLMTSSFILLRFATFSSSSSSSFNIITFKLQSSIFQQITMKSLLDRQFTTRWWWCSTCIHTYNIPSSLSLSPSLKSILTREICVIVSNSPLKNYRNYFVISMINRFLLAAYGIRRWRTKSN